MPAAGKRTMDLTGLWKIAEINALDKNFKQTWKATEGLDADDSVSEMQKTMAKTLYLFKEEGRFITIIPKNAVKDEGFEEYDEEHFIASAGEWKEEDGKTFVSTEENGEIEWTEAIPRDTKFEIFGFFRIERV